MQVKARFNYIGSGVLPCRRSFSGVCKHLSPSLPHPSEDGAASTKLLQRRWSLFYNLLRSVTCSCCIKVNLDLALDCADGEEDFDEAESDLLGDDAGDLDDEEIGDDEWGLDDGDNV